MEDCLTYLPFKAIVALKSLCNSSTQDVSNVHVFKKELRTKYDATKAICGKFPFGTEVLVYAMQNFTGGNPGTLASFYSVSAKNKAIWERVYDDLIMSMLFLNNSKNDDTKKELRRSYANGNTSAYQITLEKMARLLSSQYPMTEGQNKKKTPYDGGKSKGKGGNADANRDKENSTGKKFV